MTSLTRTVIALALGNYGRQAAFRAERSKLRFEDRLAAEDARLDNSIFQRVRFGNGPGGMLPLGQSTVLSICE